MNANGRGQLFLSTALVFGLLTSPGCSPSDPVGMGPTGSGGASADAGSGSGGSGGAGPSSGSGGTGGATSGSGGAGPTGSGGAGPTGSGGAGPTGSGGAAGQDAAAPMTDGGTRPDAGGNTDAAGSNFSFFVISMRALQTLSGNPAGFGGDLRFGQADGLSGADELCRRAAELGMPGAGQKTWRALLSVVNGPGGMPVHARDRIGNGPWYDRMGRLFAQNVTDLFSAPRPPGVLALVNDITNERGEPNHYVGAGGFTVSMTVDNHDTMTGSDTNGRQTGTNCNDWTSATANSRPMSGHSWPRSATSGRHWLADHTVPGCTPGVDRTLGGTGSGTCVGCSGGYGGFYCFAL